MNDLPKADVPCRLRPAQSTDAAALSELAARSEAHWGYDEAFMARFRELYRITPEYLAACPTFVLERGDRLLGFFSILPQESPVELEYFYVAPEEVGKGVGRLLWNHLCHYCADAGISVVEWVTSPPAEAFYLRMGALRCGQVTSTINGRLLPRLTFDFSRC